MTMLALLKTAAAVPTVRAVTVRVLSAPAWPASRRQLLSSWPAGRRQLLTSWPAQQLAGLQRRLVDALRQQSRALLRIAVVQCEFVLIYRTRRSMQLFELYSSLYDREALLEMFRSVRRLLTANGRRLLLSAALVAGHNNVSESLPPGQKDAEATEEGHTKQYPRHGYEREFECLEKLREESIVCPDCRKRQLIDRKVCHVTYCTCAGGQPTRAVNRGEDSTWVPFIERDHVVVWRQRHPEHAHLYSYKVFGSYDDVCANCFFEVQLNTAYRGQWDPSALELRVVDSQPGVNGEIIYWRVRFPSMFRSRDYVFDRRYYVDPASRQMTIVSRSAVHADCPPRADVVRVDRYWSVMVIRPHTEFDQPGMEFGLTYFDDPGTHLPPVITNYVAATGLPDFLERVAEAARTTQRQLATGKLQASLQYMKSRLRPLDSTSATAPNDATQTAARLSTKSARHVDASGAIKSGGDGRRSCAGGGTGAALGVPSGATATAGGAAETATKRGTGGAVGSASAAGSAASNAVGSIAGGVARDATGGATNSSVGESATMVLL